MKKALLTILVVFGAFAGAFAQWGNCTPDATFQDSLPGVYPLPFDEATNPTGGITDSACFNKDFQFVFTAVVGDSLAFGPSVYVLDSLKITGITGLPEGFSYACDNPTCTFYQNEIGCAAIFGKATNSADIGSHDLIISATIYTSGLGIPLSFPNPLLYPGHFYLFVLEENDPDCTVFTGAFEVASEFESVRNLPNPFSGRTTIEIQSRGSGDYQMQVSDLLGRVVHTRSVPIAEGLNKIEFDGSRLPEGMYLYTLSNGKSQVTRKMSISRH